MLCVPASPGTQGGDGDPVGAAAGNIDHYKVRRLGKSARSEAILSKYVTRFGNLERKS